MPAIAHASGCGPQYNPYGEVRREVSQRWRAYYRASVGWVDALVGRVLADLKASGDEPNTMVVFLTLTLTLTLTLSLSLSLSLSLTLTLTLTLTR